MKNIIKNEKGSITLFVLVSMLFMTMFLITMYTLSTNSEIAAKNATKKLKEKYEVGLDRIHEIYEELQEVKAYDKDGNEIENFGTYWEYDYYLEKLALKIKNKEVFKNKIDENTGELKIQIPYFLRIGENEKYIESYVSYIRDEEGNFLDSDGQITTDSTKYVEVGLFQELDIAKFDLEGTIKTDRIKYMSNMFKDCSNLIELNLGEDFVTSNVLSMSDMFASWTNTQSVYVSNADTKTIFINNAEELRS